MDKYVKITKIILEESKNMYGWLDWIVIADLPITIVENDYYIKLSHLLSTTFDSCKALHKNAFTIHV